MPNDERIILEAEPGLSGEPRRKDWEKWRWYLTVQEQQVYLYLRWRATSPEWGSVGSIRAFARGIADKDHSWKWERVGKGPMPFAAFERALNGLIQHGLVDKDEDTWD